MQRKIEDDKIYLKFGYNPNFSNALKNIVVQNGNQKQKNGCLTIDLKINRMIYYCIIMDLATGPVNYPHTKVSGLVTIQ